MRRWLAKKGFDPKFGARPLQRIIQKEIKSPLVEEILFGKLSNGGRVIADVFDDSVNFEIDDSILLRETIEFPPADLAESDGLLAIGGDLSVERLILAYRSGIFPWYNHEPILWWSPSLRPVIFPRLFSMSRSLYQTLKKKIYRVSFDRDFYSVIKGCAAAPRKDSSGTWITTEMMEAYSVLHNLGFAHSVEIWFNDKIIGGLYGVAIGNAFFGESMFTLMKDASKVALACLVKFLIEQDFYFIDCQITNPHLLKWVQLNFLAQFFKNIR